MAAKVTDGYATPRVPAGSGEVVVILTVPSLMTRVAFRVAVWGAVDESFAWIVKLLEPATVGVPERTPALLRVSPAGKVPAEMLQV